MSNLFTYDRGDLKEVILMVDRNIDEKYSPSIYDELSAPWPEGFILCKEEGLIRGLIFALSSTEGYGRIIIFCVDSGHRNRGIGNNLLAEIEERARRRGFNVLKLEVRVENYSAIEFYKKRGFTVSNVLEGFYNDGGNAYNMIKFL